LDGLAEPGDGRQPPDDGGSGPAHCCQVPGEALDVRAAGGEQDQRAAAAPADELTQVQRVRLTGQAAVVGQEPSKGDPFGIGEDGLDRGERSGLGRQWSPGHLPARLEPEDWAPAVNGNPP
jgi:hypothetical protein